MKKRKPKPNTYYYKSALVGKHRQVFPVKPIWLINFPELPNYIFYLYKDEEEKFFVNESLTGMSISGEGLFSQKDALKIAQRNLERFKDEFHKFHKIVDDNIKKYGVVPEPYVGEV